MNGDTFIIGIESLAHGGKGVGRRADGKVVHPRVIPARSKAVSLMNTPRIVRPIPKRS